MRNTRLWLVVAIGSLAMVLTPGAFAAKGGKGGGGTGGGGGSSTLPIILTFRDCAAGSPSASFANLHLGTAPQDLCPVSDDRVKSDTGLPYEDGVDSVEAFIALSGSQGALGLRLAKSTRGLFLDFSDCASGPGTCKPPLASGVDSFVALDIDANRVKRNGLLGMAVDETISSPMRILLSDTADLSGNVWFINFDPNVKGKDPCKERSSYVNVTRTSTSPSRWEVTFDPHQVACLSSSGGSFLGTYHMPLQFTVEPK